MQDCRELVGILAQRKPIITTSEKKWEQNSAYG